MHESIVPAAVAPMVAPQRRASASGLFTAGYGLSWFLDSAAIGFLYSPASRPVPPCFLRPTTEIMTRQHLPSFVGFPRLPLARKVSR